MNPKVDFYFDKAGKWQKEINLLRTIVLDCQLIEELKWGTPCYTYQNKNIVLIHTFKEYCALLFFKGALLNNAEGLLIQQSEQVQSARQIRFTDIKSIKQQKLKLRATIYEAIEVEKSGLKVVLKATTEYPIPDEFQIQLTKNKTLNKAFTALTAGRQRGYLLYFAAAKQSKTRAARVEKCIPQILIGKGLND